MGSWDAKLWKREAVSNSTLRRNLRAQTFSLTHEETTNVWPSTWKFSWFCEMRMRSTLQSPIRSDFLWELGAWFTCSKNQPNPSENVMQTKGSIEKHLKHFWLSSEDGGATHSPFVAIYAIETKWKDWTMSLFEEQTRKPYTPMTWSFCSWGDHRLFTSCSYLFVAVHGWFERYSRAVRGLLAGSSWAVCRLFAGCS